MKITDVNELKKIAINVRRGIIEAVYNAKSGHPGGSLSCADILTVLYFNEMNIDEKNPKMENRDRFVLSKGHCSPALYSTLAHRGYFEVEELKKLGNINSNLQGHPDMNKTLGVDFTTGSLGQGLSVANGMAVSAKIDKNNYRVYCLLGDGEMQEGQVWEALMFAGNHKLNNLCVIIDNNNLQIVGKVNEVMSIYPLKEKLESFKFNVIEIDGNDIQQIIKAFENAKLNDTKPTAIIAKTIKGKGVKYMENIADWHGKTPNDQEYIEAINQLC